MGIYPLKELGYVGLSAGALAGAGGKPIVESKDVRNWLVSYRPMTPVTSAHAEPFHSLGPGILLPSATVGMGIGPGDTCRIPKEFPRQFWLEYDIPKDAKPGIYRSKVDVISADAVKLDVIMPASSTVEVLIRVLPFALEEPKDVTFAVAYNSPKGWSGAAEGNPEMDFFARMGLNTIWYGGGAESQPDMEALAKARGLAVEPVSGKYANWRWPEEYRDYIIRSLLNQKKPISFQPVHTGWREGRRVRFSHGFWLWRSGIRHRVIQTQPNACERVFYAHCGHAKFGPALYLFPSLDVGQLRPAPAWFDVREGIADWRYLQTFQAALAAAGDPAQDKSGPVQAAKAYSDELNNSLKVSLDYYYFKRKRDFNHVDRFGLTDNVWPGRRYEMERWEMALHTARLKKADMSALAMPGDAPAPRGATAAALVAVPRAAAPAPPTQPILHAEYFGPFWVDERQYLDYVNTNPGAPKLLAETPKTPAGQNWATVLALLEQVNEQTWSAVLADAAGKEICRQKVGPLKRWKTRWVLNTAGLAPGKYTIKLVPDAGDPAPDAQATITVLPAMAADSR